MCKCRCMYMVPFRNGYKCIELEQHRECPYTNFECEIKKKNLQKV